MRISDWSSDGGASDLAMRMSDRQRGAMPLRLSQQFVELCVDCCGLRVVIEKHPSSRCRQTVRAGNRIGHAARTCIAVDEIADAMRVTLFHQPVHGGTAR